MVPSRAAQTAFVPELSKAITFCLTSYPGEIERPALFRGRLMAFGKCTDGGASSKGMQNLESV